MRAAIRMPSRLPLVSLAYGMIILVAPAVLQAQAVFDGAAIGDVKDLAISAEERQYFIGRYIVTSQDSAQPPVTIRFYEVEGALFGQGGGDPTRMLYQGSNIFRPEAETVYVITFTVEGDRATRFSMVWPEGSMEGVRVNETEPP